MKCKFHRPTSMIHLKMCNKNYFFSNFFLYLKKQKKKKKLKNIINKPRMKCMNVMQRKILMKNTLITQD